MLDDQIHSLMSDMLDRMEATHNSTLSMLDTVLQNLVAQHSRNVYDDATRLQSLLELAGLDSLTVHKLCLLVATDGFAHMLLTESKPTQTDVNIFVANAQAQTGLTRTEVRRLLRSVLLSVEAAYDLNCYDETVAGIVAEQAYVIPESLYGDEIHTIQNSMMAASVNKRVIPPSVQAKLEALVAAGVPKAKQILGDCMLRGLIPDASEELGLQLLKEAAEACDSGAGGLLGDYYYNKGLAAFEALDESKGDTPDAMMSMQIRGNDMWSKAFEYYTGFGSLALTPRRKRRVMNIYNHGVFNQRLLICSAFLLLLMLLTLVLAPGSTSYAPHYIWGVICLLACGGYFWLAKKTNDYRPYNDVYALPVLMFVLWTLFVGVRLFFY